MDSRRVSRDRELLPLRRNERKLAAGGRRRRQGCGGLDGGYNIDFPSGDLGLPSNPPPPPPFAGKHQLTIFSSSGINKEEILTEREREGYVQNNSSLRLLVLYKVPLEYF